MARDEKVNETDLPNNTLAATHELQMNNGLLLL